MNQKGAQSLLSSKVKLGANASAAAGPKGRTAEVATDIVMNAEILSYSRNKGLFAGVSLEVAPGILTHMNADHVDSMILLARSHVGAEATEAIMTSVDRLGFTLRLKTSEGMKGVRINFPREVATPMETRTVLVEMVRQARQ